jgi:hypothetical protein
MPSYRPPVSRNQFHELEAYYYKLIMYTGTWDFRNLLDGDKKTKIWHEINTMQITLQILSKLFTAKGVHERAVVAWRLNPEEDESVFIYTFSCIKVAALVTGCNQSKISAVCKGKRENTSGEGYRNAKTGKISRHIYKFVYEDEHEEKK